MPQEHLVVFDIETIPDSDHYEGDGFTYESTGFSSALDAAKKKGDADALAKRLLGLAGGARAD